MSSGCATAWPSWVNKGSSWTRSARTLGIWKTCGNGSAASMKPSRTPPGKPNRKVDPVQQLLTESVDATRTMLVHLTRTQGVRTVMVTSAVAGEGKTSLSCRLAVSLARSGLRTLLIDGDTRNPSVHKVFGLPCEEGFCEALYAGIDAPSAVRETPVPGLSVLPAGRWSEQM